MKKQEMIEELREYIKKGIEECKDEVYLMILRYIYEKTENMKKRDIHIYEFIVEAIREERLIYEFSRGGGLGIESRFLSNTLSDRFGIDNQYLKDSLPSYYGCCERDFPFAEVVASGFNNDLWDEYTDLAEFLDKLADKLWLIYEYLKQELYKKEVKI
ncbi:MAG: hypothetical protein RMI01_09785 [Thermodesulfovibrio sp.]|nr:hypothetical protein [Thermodesulfovibrio sp.]